MKKKSYIKVSTWAGIVAVVYAVLLLILVRVEAGIAHSTIRDYSDGIWFLVATLSSVGYGDATPASIEGRFIGGIFLLTSLALYGFIIGRIANFMNTLKEKRELGLNGTSFKNHVVVIGWNEFGQSVVNTLVAAGRQVAVVTKDRPMIDIIHEYYTEDQVFTLYSDYNNFDFLEKANIAQSSIVFINLNDDTEKLAYIINIKKHYSELKYVVTLDNGNLKNTFQNAGVTYTISKHEISSKLLASYIYEPDVALFSEELIAFAHEDHEYDIKQFLITENNPLVGVPYEKAFFDLKKQCNVILIGVVKIEHGKRVLYKNPSENIKIEAGNYLMALMDRKGQEKMRLLFKMVEGV
jgi:voltage-gated potassium channel